MTLISSKYLFFTKKGFPLLWFGLLAVFVASAIADGAYKQAPLSVAVPLVMAVSGYFLMKKLVWDLVDEVYDFGDFLLVKNRGEEEKVFLSNIMNVDASTNMSPPRITLQLVKPGRFGAEISVSPAFPLTLNPFAKNQIAEDLIVRVDKERSKRAL